MSYCTTTSVYNYLVGYKSSDTATSNVVTESIADAKNEINKYLGDRYDVTTWDTATPPMVNTICKWYAAGLSVEALSRGSKEALKRSEKLIDRATKNLEAINEGKLAIVDSNGDEIAKINDPSQVMSTTEDYSNTFNEDNPLRWKVSSTKITAIKSERDE
jgi:phage gp36-like protein